MHRKFVFFAELALLTFQGNEVLGQLDNSLKLHALNYRFIISFFFGRIFAALLTKILEQEKILGEDIICCPYEQEVGRGDSDGARVAGCVDVDRLVIDYKVDFDFFAI